MDCDKENNGYIRQPSKKKVKTPPRFRDGNSRNATPKDADTSKEEDFSFNKLRGAVQNFEKDQREHLRRSATKKKSSRRSIDQDDGQKEAKRARFCVEKSQHETSIMASSARRKVAEQSKSDKSICTAGSKATKEGRDNKQEKEEDFSFSKLKAMAVDMDKSNSYTTLGIGGQLLPTNAPKPRADDNFKLLLTPTKGMKDDTRHRRGSFNGSSTAFVHRSLTPLRRAPAAPRYDHTPVRQRKEQIVPASMPLLRKSESKIHHPSMISKQAVGSKGRCYIPSTKYLYKEKIQSKEVQATNDTNASVQKLAQWLADDPLKKSKKLVLKKSDEIRLKAKAFESRNDDFEGSDTSTNTVSEPLSTIQKERGHFPRGKVSEGKSWLKGAFGEGAEEETDDKPLGVKEKRLMFESRFK